MDNPKIKGILANKNRKKTPMDLRFKKNVKTLFYYEPKSFNKAEIMYERKRFSVRGKEDAKYICFLRPQEYKYAIGVTKKSRRKLDKKFEVWRKNYHKDLDGYENEEFKYENQYIEDIQDRFDGFPCSDEFAYVFKKYRHLREFISRIRNYKCLKLCRTLISWKRYDLAHNLLDYIEKDSLFLNEIEGDDFDGVRAIPESMVAELVSYVDIPEEDDELYERWQAYFGFFANPQGEFLRLKKIWQETYIGLVNACALQAAMDNDAVLLRKLVTRTPVKSCKEHSAFEMNPYVRVDYYFSKRGSRVDELIDRGKVLLLMVNLGHVGIAKLFVKNGLAIESSSCGGNMNQITWEYKAKEEKVFEIDLEDSDMDIDEYIRLRDEMLKINEEPAEEDDFDNDGPLLDFDANSFDSDEEDEYIMREYEDFADEEEEEGATIELTTSFSRINVICCAVNVNQEDVLKFVMDVNINPFQNQDAGIRSIRKQVFLDVLGVGSSKTYPMATLAEHLIKRAERLLIERTQTIRKQYKRKFGSNIHSEERLIPWQNVHGIILAQIFLEMETKNELKECIGDFLSSYFRYFSSRSTRQRTMKKKKAKKKLRLANASARSSRRSRKRGTNLLLESLRDSSDDDKEWQMMTSSRKRLSLKNCGIAGSSFRFPSRRDQGTVVENLYKQDTKTLFPSEETRKTNSHKFKNPVEEFHIRLLLAIDYLMKEQNQTIRVSASRVGAILAIVTSTSLILDSKRNSDIVDLLFNGIIEEVPGIETLCVDAISNCHSLRAFFGLKNVGRNMKELREVIPTRSNKELLSMKYSGAFNYRMGFTAFNNFVFGLAETESLGLIKTILDAEEISLSKNQSKICFESLKDSYPEAANLFRQKYPQHFENRD